MYLSPIQSGESTSSLDGLEYSDNLLLSSFHVYSFSTCRHFQSYSEIQSNTNTTQGGRVGDKKGRALTRCRPNALWWQAPSPNHVLTDCSHKRLWVHQFYNQLTNELCSDMVSTLTPLPCPSRLTPLPISHLLGMIGEATSSCFHFIDRRTMEWCCPTSFSSVMRCNRDRTRQTSLIAEQLPDLVLDLGLSVLGSTILTLGCE